VDGVVLAGPDATGNVIQGNCIGTDRSGTAALPNGGFGVRIGGNLRFIPGDGANNNFVGVLPTGTGGANTIAFNKAGGVIVSGVGSVGNRISQNAIFSNGTPQSSPEPNIVLANGGNNNIPAPGIIMIQVISVSPGILQIRGTLGGFSQATIELFAGPGGPNGGGRFFLTSVPLQVDGTFTAVISESALHGQQFIVATATDSLNDTSPFSTPKAVPGGSIGGLGGNGNPGNNPAP
jgi:hypothetical protein